MAYWWQATTRMQAADAQALRAAVVDPDTEVLDLVEELITDAANQGLSVMRINLDSADRVQMAVDDLAGRGFSAWSPDSGTLLQVNW